MSEATGIWTSPDGLWFAIRRGREITLLATGPHPTIETITEAGPVGRLTLPADDVDLAFVAPGLVAVTRGDIGDRVILYEPPYLEAVARHDLDAPSRLAASTGPRLVLSNADGTQVTILRVAPRALAAQALDGTGPVEFIVGLEKNQILLSLMKKLEVWDAVSGRPVLRLQLQLPPAPRTAGAAQGHLWVVRPGSDEVFVYRLSDGRPFRHYAGAAISEVICHPASPLVVLATPRGLLRLHCFAHSVAVIDAPWTPGQALAQLVIGEDISLLGLGDHGVELWRVPISGSSAQLVAEPVDARAPEPPPVAASSAADKLREMRANQLAALPHVSAVQVAAPVAVSPPPAAALVPPPARRLGDWREVLVPLGHELARGADVELPEAAPASDLGELMVLANRLGLGGPARRALAALYALHLVGEPGLAVARLARACTSWDEALGKGELGALALLDRSAAKVGLRRPVTDLLDGTAPRVARLVGGAPSVPRAGAFRTGRDGRTDAELEAQLAAQLGRIAVIETVDDLDDGLLEARLHGATAVALAAPPHRPRPWPRDAGLVLVLPGSPSAWLADLPSL